MSTKKISFLFLIFWSAVSFAGVNYGNLSVTKVNSVYDGDTFRANLSSGHPLISNNIRVRLSGIDTPEMKSKCWRERQLAKKARDYLRKRLKGSNDITLKNLQRGKYFRIVADVFIDGVNINKELVDKKLAYVYKKGRKNNWCDGEYGWINLKGEY